MELHRNKLLEDLLDHVQKDEQIHARIQRQHKIEMNALQSSYDYEMDQYGNQHHARVPAMFPQKLTEIDEKYRSAFTAERDRSAGPFICQMHNLDLYYYDCDKFMTKWEWKAEASPSVLRLLDIQVEKNVQFYECYHKWHMTARDVFLTNTKLTYQNCICIMRSDTSFQLRVSNLTYRQYAKRLCFVS